MSTLMLTILIAFVFVILAIAGLAIGWLFTGKSSIRAGSCGRLPNKDRDQGCGTNSTCSLCEKETEKKIDENK